MKVWRCKTCPADTVVVVTHLGYAVTLDAAQLPADRAVEGYEHHPYYGWHNVTSRAGYQRRGHPIHAPHECTRKASQ